MRNMDEKTKQEIWPFIIQLPTVCLGPIAFGYTIIQSLATAGPKDPPSWAGHVYLLIIFLAFPAGLAGMKYIKRHAGALGSLEKPTKVLAIINLIMGGIMGGLMGAFLLFLLIFAIVAVFSGITA